MIDKVPDLESKSDPFWNYATTLRLPFQRVDSRHQTAKPPVGSFWFFVRFADVSDVSAASVSAG
jgi:hypothetical protein